jgi:hypothetical protein
MTLLITRDILNQAGINLDGKDIDALLTHLNQTLEERVGTEITASLSDEQLNELLDLQEKGDDEAVADWLQANVEELDQIAQDEIDILLGELAENSDGINEHQ